MADLSSVTSMLPSKQTIFQFGANTFGVITIIIIAAIVIGIISLILFFYLRNKKFNKTIVIFEEMNGRWEQTGKDKAMEVKLNRMGDTVFYLRKRKKYIPVPELQTGKRTYWYAIREDGEWINIALENINTKMKQAGAKFLHPEMRAWRTASARNLKERYDEPKFMQKYGVLLVNIAAITIICIFLWLIVDKIISVGDKVNAMAQTGKEVMDKAGQVLASLDNVCTGSGARAAGMFIPLLT